MDCSRELVHFVTCGDESDPTAGCRLRCFPLLQRSFRPLGHLEYVGPVCFMHLAKLFCCVFATFITFITMLAPHAAREQVEAWRLLQD